MDKRKVQLPVDTGDAFSYLVSVKKAFHDEVAKYDEFLKAVNELTTHKVDVDNVIVRVEELLKNHHDLLLGFNVCLPDGAKITISPEVKGTISTAAAQHSKSKSYYTKENSADAEKFMNKLKTRFWRHNTHVVESFQNIMKMLKEGKMSENKAYDEVTNILYYHEDLINDFSKLFTKSDPIATSSLLLQE